MFKLHYSDLNIMFMADFSFCVNYAFQKLKDIFTLSLSMHATKQTFYLFIFLNCDVTLSITI